MIYMPSKTIKAFHNARNTASGFVRALIGGVGNGKSVACCMELVAIAMQQAPDRENVRRTKFAIVRNTYRELADTTMATFFSWIPKDSGEYSAKNLSFRLEQELSDGTTMDATFLFRALDKPDDVGKLLSLEITAAWINEAREIPLAIVEAIQTRFRYPSPMYGVKPTFLGLILDTNPPDTDHWFYRLFEEDLPHNHKIFHMPSGTSPYAENTEHLPPNYYENMMAGKGKEWINVYVHGQYGFVQDGKPIYPEYKDDIHYSEHAYTPNPLLPIYIGLDFGLTPAATFGQITSTGRFVVFDELVTFDMGTVRFSSLLKQKLAQPQYRNHKAIEIYGDPAGDIRSQVDEETPYMALQAQGIVALPTHTNDPVVRRETVVSFLTTLDSEINPSFCITPGAPTFRKAMAGGYKYKRLQVTNDERYHDKPDKNKYSHVAEAGQYMILGAVGTQRIFGKSNSSRLDYSRMNRGVI
jgi:hypothetical protein